MNVAHNQVYLSNVSPIQAFKDMSLEQGSLSVPNDLKKSNGKRKRGSLPSRPEPSRDATSIDEDSLGEKLSSHFLLLRDIKENQRLRSELDHTTSSLQLYEEYKQQKIKDKKAKSKKISLLNGVSKWFFPAPEILINFCIIYYLVFHVIVMQLFLSRFSTIFGDKFEFLLIKF